MTDVAAAGAYLLFEFGSLSDRAGGGDVFAIDVREVGQVIETEHVTPVPLSPALVEGIINHHGRIVTVVDPAPLLGLEAQPQPASQVVVVRRGPQGSVGFKVVRTGGIVPESGLEGVDIPTTQFVARIGKRGARLVHLLALDGLLQALEAKFEGATRDEGPGRQGAKT